MCDFLYTELLYLQFAFLDFIAKVNVLKMAGCITGCHYVSLSVWMNVLLKCQFEVGNRRPKCPKDVNWQDSPLLIVCVIQSLEMLASC